MNQTYPNNVYEWNPEKGYMDLDFDEYIPRRPLGSFAIAKLNL